MANEDEPKSPENPLEEMAKSIGSTLGTAANRASEMLRDVMPAALSEKLGVGSPQAKPRKAASAKKAQSPAKKKTTSRKSVAKKKSRSARPAAKKKASSSSKKRSARKSR